MAGEAIARYRLRELLAEGGMGRIFRAEDTRLGREVAVKALRPELAGEPAFRERFRREAERLAGLRHPNIVAFLAFLEEDGCLFLVMEYLRGQTFAELLRDHPEGLPWRRAAALALPVLSALEHAHGQGVVHGDIKPANLLLTSDGSVRVLDFGVAQSAGDAPAGALMEGTLRYMSPERIRARNLDGRSDLYSLALVLHELLTGIPAFADGDEQDLIQAQMETPPPCLPRDLPPGLEPLILKALAKRPEDRFDSAGEFRCLLEGAMREASSWEQRPPDAVPSRFLAGRFRIAAAEPTLRRPFLTPPRT